MDGIRAQDGQLTNDEVASLELLSPLYLGSAPESLHQYLKVKYTVLAHCIAVSYYSYHSITLFSDYTFYLID